MERMRVPYHVALFVLFVSVTSGASTCGKQNDNARYVGSEINVDYDATNKTQCCDACNARSDCEFYWFRDKCHMYKDFQGLDYSTQTGSSGLSSDYKLTWNDATFHPEQMYTASKDVTTNELFFWYLVDQPDGTQPLAVHTIDVLMYIWTIDTSDSNNMDLTCAQIAQSPGTQKKTVVTYHTREFKKSTGTDVSPPFVVLREDSDSGVATNLVRSHPFTALDGVHKICMCTENCDQNNVTSFTKDAGYVIVDNNIISSQGSVPLTSFLPDDNDVPSPTVHTYANSAGKFEVSWHFGTEHNSSEWDFFLIEPTHDNDLEAGFECEATRAATGANVKTVMARLNGGLENNNWCTAESCSHDTTYTTIEFEGLTEGSYYLCYHRVIGAVGTNVPLGPVEVADTSLVGITMEPLHFTVPTVGKGEFTIDFDGLLRSEEDRIGFVRIDSNRPMKYASQNGAAYDYYYQPEEGPRLARGCGMSELSSVASTIYNPDISSTNVDQDAPGFTRMVTENNEQTIQFEYAFSQSGADDAILTKSAICLCHSGNCATMSDTGKAIVKKNGIFHWNGNYFWTNGYNSPMFHNNYDLVVGYLHTIPYQNAKPSSIYLHPKSSDIYIGSIFTEITQWDTNDMFMISDMPCGRPSVAQPLFFGGNYTWTYGKMAGGDPSIEFYRASGLRQNLLTQSPVEQDYFNYPADALIGQNFSFAELEGYEYVCFCAASTSQNECNTTEPSYADFGATTSEINSFIGADDLHQSEAQDLMLNSQISNIPPYQGTKFNITTWTMPSSKDKFYLIPFVGGNDVPPNETDVSNMDYECGKTPFAFEDKWEPSTKSSSDGNVQVTSNPMSVSRGFDLGDRYSAELILDQPILDAFSTRRYKICYCSYENEDHGCTHVSQFVADLGDAYFSMGGSSSVIAVLQNNLELKAVNTNDTVAFLAETVGASTFHTSKSSCGYLKQQEEDVLKINNNSNLLREGDRYYIVNPSQYDIGNNPGKWGVCSCSLALEGGDRVNVNRCNNKDEKYFPTMQGSVLIGDRSFSFPPWDKLSYGVKNGLDFLSVQTAGLLNGTKLELNRDVFPGIWNKGSGEVSDMDTIRFLKSTATAEAKECWNASDSDYAVMADGTNYVKVEHFVEDLPSWNVYDRQNVSRMRTQTEVHFQDANSTGDYTVCYCQAKFLANETINCTSENVGRVTYGIAVVSVFDEFPAKVNLTTAAGYLEYSSGYIGPDNSSATTAFNDTWFGEQFYLIPPQCYCGVHLHIECANSMEYGRNDFDGNSLDDFMWYNGGNRSILSVPHEGNGWDKAVVNPFNDKLAELFQAKPADAAANMNATPYNRMNFTQSGFTVYGFGNPQTKKVCWVPNRLVLSDPDTLSMLFIYDVATDPYFVAGGIDIGTITGRHFPSYTANWVLQSLKTGATRNVQKRMTPSNPSDFNDYPGRSNGSSFPQFNDVNEWNKYSIGTDGDSLSLFFSNWTHTDMENNKTTYAFLGAPEVGDMVGWQTTVGDKPCNAHHVKEYGKITSVRYDAARPGWYAKMEVTNAIVSEGIFMLCMCKNYHADACNTDADFAETSQVTNGGIGYRIFVGTLDVVEAELNGIFPNKVTTGQDAVKLTINFGSSNNLTLDDSSDDQTKESLGDKVMLLASEQTLAVNLNEVNSFSQTSQSICGSTPSESAGICTANKGYKTYYSGDPVFDTLYDQAAYVVSVTTGFSDCNETLCNEQLAEGEELSAIRYKKEECSCYVSAITKWNTNFLCGNTQESAFYRVFNTGRFPVVRNTYEDSFLASSISDFGANVEFFYAEACKKSVLGEGISDGSHCVDATNLSPKSAGGCLKACQDQISKSVVSANWNEGTEECCCFAKCEEWDCNAAEKPNATACRPPILNVALFGKVPKDHCPINETHATNCTGNAQIACDVNCEANQKILLGSELSLKGTTQMRTYSFTINSSPAVMEVCYCNLALAQARGSDCDDYRQFFRVGSVTSDRYLMLDQQISGPMTYTVAQDIMPITLPNSGSLDGATSTWTGHVLFKHKNCELDEMQNSYVTIEYDAMKGLGSYYSNFSEQIYLSGSKLNKYELRRFYPVMESAPANFSALAPDFYKLCIGSNIGRPDQAAAPFTDDAGFIYVLGGDRENVEQYLVMNRGTHIENDFELHFDEGTVITDPGQKFQVRLIDHHGMCGNLRSDGEMNLTKHLKEYQSDHYALSLDYELLIQNYATTTSFVAATLSQFEKKTNSDGSYTLSLSTEEFFSQLGDGWLAGNFKICYCDQASDPTVPCKDEDYKKQLGRVFVTDMFIYDKHAPTKELPLTQLTMYPGEVDQSEYNTFVSEMTDHTQRSLNFIGGRNLAAGAIVELVCHGGDGDGSGDCKSDGSSQESFLVDGDESQDWVMDLKGAGYRNFVTIKLTLPTVALLDGAAIAFTDYKAGIMTNASDIDSGLDNPDVVGSNYSYSFDNWDNVLNMVQPNWALISVKPVGGASTTSEETDKVQFTFKFPQTESPTTSPTKSPTKAPTDAPTAAPTDAPTTAAPTDAPTTAAPTDAPTESPTNSPTTTPVPVAPERRLSARQLHTTSPTYWGALGDETVKIKEIYIFGRPKADFVGDNFHLELRKDNCSARGITNWTNTTTMGKYELAPTEDVHLGYYRLCYERAVGQPMTTDFSHHIATASSSEIRISPTYLKWQTGLNDNSFFIYRYAPGQPSFPPNKKAWIAQSNESCAEASERGIFAVTGQGTRLGFTVSGYDLNQNAYYYLCTEDGSHANLGVNVMVDADVSLTKTGLNLQSNDSYLVGGPDLSNFYVGTSEFDVQFVQDSKDCVYFDTQNNESGTSSQERYANTNTYKFFPPLQYSKTKYRVCLRDNSTGMVINYGGALTVANILVVPSSVAVKPEQKLTITSQGSVIEATDRIQWVREDVPDCPTSHSKSASSSDAVLADSDKLEFDFSSIDTTDTNVFRLCVKQSDENLPILDLDTVKIYAGTVWITSSFSVRNKTGQNITFQDSGFLLSNASNEARFCDLTGATCSSKEVLTSKQMSFDFDSVAVNLLHDPFVLHFYPNGNSDEVQIFTNASVIVTDLVEPEIDMFNRGVLNEMDMGWDGEITNTASPTSSPTEVPTTSPTTSSPTDSPTTVAPTDSPTTKSPTDAPTTKSPTDAPTTTAPTTKNPTDAPTTKNPTDAPTDAPTSAPTSPTDAPTTKVPTTAPTTGTPTAAPTTSAPTSPTTQSPTFAPTSSPTLSARRDRGRGENGRDRTGSRGGDRTGSRGGDRSSSRSRSGSRSRSRSSGRTLLSGATKSTSLMYGDFAWWTHENNKKCGNSAPLKPTAEESSAVRITQPDYEYEFTWLKDATPGPYFLCVARAHTKRVDTIDVQKITIVEVTISPMIAALNQSALFNVTDNSGYLQFEGYSLGFTDDEPRTTSDSGGYAPATNKSNGDHWVVVEATIANAAHQYFSIASPGNNNPWTKMWPARVQPYLLNVENDQGTAIYSYDASSGDKIVLTVDPQDPEIEDGDYLWWSMKQYPCGDPRLVPSDERSKSVFPRSDVTNVTITNSKIEHIPDFANVPGGNEYRICAVSSSRKSASIVDFETSSLYVYHGSASQSHPTTISSADSSSSREFCFSGSLLKKGDSIFYSSTDDCSSPVCDETVWPEISTEEVCLEFTGFVDVSAFSKLFTCATVMERKRAGNTIQLGELSVTSQQITAFSYRDVKKEVLEVQLADNDVNKGFAFVPLNETCNFGGKIDAIRQADGKYLVTFSADPIRDDPRYALCEDNTLLDGLTVIRGFVQIVDIWIKDVTNASDVIMSGMKYNPGMDQIGYSCSEYCPSLPDANKVRLLGANETHTDRIYLRNQQLPPANCSGVGEITLCLYRYTDHVKVFNFGSTAFSEDADLGTFFPPLTSGSTALYSRPNVLSAYKFVEGDCASNSTTFKDNSPIRLCGGNGSSYATRPEWGAVVGRVFFKDENSAVPANDEVEFTLDTSVYDVFDKSPFSSGDAIAWVVDGFECSDNDTVRTNYSEKDLSVYNSSAGGVSVKFNFSHLDQFAPTTLHLCLSDGNVDLKLNATSIRLENTLSAKALGDPHIQTADGRWVDFYGDVGTYELFQGASFVANARFVLAAREDVESLIWHPRVMKAGTMMEEVAVSVVGSGRTARVGVYGGGLLSINDPSTGTSFLTSQEARVFDFGDVSISWFACKKDCEVEMPWGKHTREQVLQVEGPGEAMTLYVAHAGGYRFIDAEVDMLPAMQAPRSEATGLLADAMLRPKHVQGSIYNGEEDQYLRATVAPALGK